MYLPMSAINSISLCSVSTHEKMTRLGSLFLEKGRRSGSCFDVQSSMMRYCIRKCPKISGRSGAQLRCFRDKMRLLTKDAAVK